VLNVTLKPHWSCLTLWFLLRTRFNPDGDVAQQVQQQFLLEMGRGVWSWLHIEDAAIAVAAAEQNNPGVYLIANDQPLAVREWLPAFARWLNAPPPPQVSVEDALKRDGGADVVYYGTQMRAYRMPRKPN